MAARVALVAGALTAAAPAQAAPIIGGTPTAPGEHAHQALVLADLGESRGYCGGTLVAARFVVTAAHCLHTADGTPARSAMVILGHEEVPWEHGSVQPEDFPPESRFGVLRWEAHDQFALGGRPVNDVAMLELDRRAPFAQARLPRAADAAAWAPGTVGTALGWGVTESGEPSQALLEVDLPLIDDEACAAAWSAEGTGFIDPSRMLCAAATNGRDACAGDSGGPLLGGRAGVDPQRMLVGVTSFGASQCGAGTPGVYAELGDPGLEAWLRARIPQVEIDVAGTPEPNVPATLHAVGGTPDGPYETHAWDIDGDGFDDGGDRRLTRTFGRGVHVVAVRATHLLGRHAEVRRIALHVGVPEDATPAPAPAVLRHRALRGRVVHFDAPGRTGVRIRATAGRTILATARARAGASRAVLRLTRAGRAALRERGRMEVTLEYRAPDGAYLRKRAMTIRWISFVPS